MTPDLCQVNKNQTRTIINQENSPHRPDWRKQFLNWCSFSNVLPKNLSWTLTGAGLSCCLGFLQSCCLHAITNSAMWDSDTLLSLATSLRCCLEPQLLCAGCKRFCRNESSSPQSKMVFVKKKLYSINSGHFLLPQFLPYPPYQPNSNHFISLSPFTKQRAKLKKKIKQGFFFFKDEEKNTHNENHNIQAKDKEHPPPKKKHP